VLSSLPLVVFVGSFVVAGAIIWISGIQLSNTTDILSDRFGLGQALGGLILLAFVTNLPEIAITTTAALNYSARDRGVGSESYRRRGTANAAAARHCSISRHDRA